MEFSFGASLACFQGLGQLQGVQLREALRVLLQNYRTSPRCVFLNTPFILLKLPLDFTSANQDVQIVLHSSGIFWRSLAFGCFQKGFSSAHKKNSEIGVSDFLKMKHIGQGHWNFG